jgi:glycine betaine/proline transport system ATP-binding protein
MTARSLMRPITPGARHGGSVAASAKIASFAAEIVGDHQAFAVMDDGRAIGEVCREAVIDLLAGRDRAESTA